jgi:hypothetical protein
LAELRALYEHNVQSIRGLFLRMPKGEPLVVDYNRWLYAEVTGLPEVFSGMNKIFVSIAVEGTLIMVGGSINLAALQAIPADSRADILPVK